MTHYDDGVRFKLYVSLDGDFVSLGSRTDYPFVTGGAGIPLGWTYWVENGTAGDANVTTANGRFSVSNASDTVSHNGGKYVIYRDFPVTPNHRYLFQVQSQMMKDKTIAYRAVQYQFNGTGGRYGTSLLAYPDWEQISLPVLSGSATSIRLYLTVNPYWGNPANQTFDWGGQFQNVAIVDQLASYPDPTWHEITCDSLSFRARYGRSKFTSRYEVASCEIEVTNDDGEYSYNPAHEWGLRPGRFLKVEATRPGSATTYPMFYGIIDSLTDAYARTGKAGVSMSCLDTSSLLSNMTVPTVTGESSVLRSGERFYRVYAAAGWLDQMASRDAGVYDQQTILANGRTVRDELGLIADSEGSSFYCDRLGRLIYRDRNTDQPSWRNVQAELLGECEPTEYYAMLDFPGVPGNYLSVPHEAAFNFNSFTFIFRMKPDITNRNETLLDKGTTWTLRKLADGRLQVSFGGSPYISTVPLPYANGVGFWLKVIRDAAANTVRFYTADYNQTGGNLVPPLASMTQLGTTITTTGVPGTNINELFIGSNFPQTNQYAGIIDRVAIQNGVDGGTTVFDVRTDMWPPGIDGNVSFTAQSGQLVKANQTGSYELLARDMSRAPSHALPVVDTIPNALQPAVVHLQSLATDWSRDRVVNDIQLANQGGSAFQFINGDSQRRYGPRTYQRLDLLNRNDHPEYLIERSNDLMDGYTEAVLRVNSVSFRPNMSNYLYAVSVFLNDLVRVRYTNRGGGWGFSVVSHVQQVEHTITPKDWQVQLLLDNPEAFNRWDASTLGTGWDEGVWDTTLWDGAEVGQWSRNSVWSDGVSVWGK